MSVALASVPPVRGIATCSIFHPGRGCDTAKLPHNGDVADGCIRSGGLGRRSLRNARGTQRARRSSDASVRSSAGRSRHRRYASAAARGGKERRCRMSRHAHLALASVRLRQDSQDGRHEYRALPRQARRPRRGRHTVRTRGARPSTADYLRPDGRIQWLSWQLHALRHGTLPNDARYPAYFNHIPARGVRRHLGSRDGVRTSRSASSAAPGRKSFPGTSSSAR